VKKRFAYYYRVVDAMSERASARPRASTDTMTMAPSSPSSSLEVDENDEDDVSLPQEPKELKKMLKKGYQQGQRRTATTRCLNFNCGNCNSRSG
jgi:hypothetical protein